TGLVSYESDVSRLVKVGLTQGQFDALVSFTYNLGARSLSTSTLLRKLNAGDYAGAADEFLRWNKAGGKVLNGLTRRREAERALFLS
ncbi:lysozyme, partial [Enterobacter hormaechei]